jgi:hypothetical protein
MATGITILQASREDGIDHRTRDDTQLPDACDGVRESPVGRGNADAAFNDAREREGRVIPNTCAAKYPMV